MSNCNDSACIASIEKKHYVPAVVSSIVKSGNT